MPKKPKKPKIKVRANQREVTAILVANPNGVIAQKDLPEIVRIFQEITDKYGGVTHQSLYAASKQPGNETLAKYYTQDPGKAAQKCWQQESYKIIASVQVFIKENKALEPVRAMVRVEDPDEQPMYKFATTVFSNDDLMQQQIQKALEELELWERKYQNLVSYSKFFRRTHARVTKIVVGIRKSFTVDPTDA